MQHRPVPDLPSLEAVHGFAQGAITQEATYLENITSTATLQIIFRRHVNGAEIDVVRVEVTRWQAMESAGRSRLLAQGVARASARAAPCPQQVARVALNTVWSRAPGTFRLPSS